MNREKLRGIFLMIGLFWGVIGFVLWVPTIPANANIFYPTTIQNLIFYVVGPVLLFIFAAIILSINDIHSNV